VSFEQQLGDLIDGAKVALLVSIGHQVGLFEILDAAPLGADETAIAADLEPRYVREWLAAMTAAGILDHRAGRFALPAGRAAALRRAGVAAQEIALLGNVEQAVVRAFRRGGGVGRAAYGRLEALPHDAPPLEDALPVDLRVRLAAGADLLDLGCGRGALAHRLATAFPNSRIRGWDVSVDAITAASLAADRAHLGNARFDVADAAELAGPPHLDVIVALDVIGELRSPEAAIHAAAAALRPAGALIVAARTATGDLAADVALPGAAAAFAASCLHTVPVSLADGGAGLGAMAGDARLRPLLESAFPRVDACRVAADPTRTYYIARRES
jgi:2-polyprenyl-3-methyl-5-hydroxy-6-metoxy-1,4-benzoquinol methylase